MVVFFDKERLYLSHLDSYDGAIPTWLLITQATSEKG